MDRDADNAGLVVTFNKNDSMALASQRQRLPIFKARVGTVGGVMQAYRRSSALDFLGSLALLRR